MIDRRHVATVTNDPAPRTTPDARVALIAACAGFFMIVLDTSAVYVALPSVSADLGADLRDLQWIVDGYLVAFAALLLSCGSLSDQVGATRSFAWGLAGFTLASIACAAAPTLGVLIAARILQGLGAAVMLPSSLALVRQSHLEPKARAQAITLWTAAGGVGLALGPVLGGVLTEAFDWRAIFYINVPVGLAGIVLLRRITASRPRPVVIDISGQIAAIAALGGLTLGVIEGGHEGFGSLPAICGLALFVVAGIAFVAIERRKLAPMLPLDLFASATVSTTAATGFVLNLAFYGQIFVLSLFFQGVIGDSALIAGLMFLPMTVLITAANVVAGPLISRFGLRPPLVVGQIVFGIALTGLVFIDESTPRWVILALMAPVGIAAGIAVPPLTTAMLEAVSHERSGVTSGLLAAARQSGGAIGVAIFGALLGGSSFVAGMHVSAIIGGVAAIATGIACAIWVRPGAPIHTEARDWIEDSGDAGLANAGEVGPLT